MCDCTSLSRFYTYKLINCTSVRITISDWRTGTHWDVGQSINDDTIQLLSVSLIILRPIQREWPGSNWTLNSHRTKRERGKWPVAIHFQSKEARQKWTWRSAGRRESGEWCAGGLMPWRMVGVPRWKFKRAISVTEFGIQCTQKAHRIVKGTDDFC